jgi:hypothetical protein
VEEATCGEATSDDFEGGRGLREREREREREKEVLLTIKKRESLL